jgi:2'-5' RNA ligase superfamily
VQTGLILAMPGLAIGVRNWRRAALPGSRLDVPAHLSVLYPWVDREPIEEDRLRVLDATRDLRRFVVTFREVGTFPGFIWLRPDPPDAVGAVYGAVAGAFAELSPYAGKHPHVIPHLTVATCEPEETPRLAARVAAALANPLLPELGGFEAEGIDVALRGSEEEPFEVRRLATFGEGCGPMLGSA